MKKIKPIKISDLKIPAESTKNVLDDSYKPDYSKQPKKTRKPLPGTRPEED
jgi:hypothetical protein